MAQTLQIEWTNNDPNATRHKVEVQIDAGSWDHHTWVDMPTATTTYQAGEGADYKARVQAYNGDVAGGILEASVTHYIPELIQKFDSADTVLSDPVDWDQEADTVSHYATGGGSGTATYTFDLGNDLSGWSSGDSVDIYVKHAEVDGTESDITAITVDEELTDAAADPVISPSSGTIYTTTTISITSTPSVPIYYRTDGNDPTDQDTLYNDTPFTLSAGSITVKAIAVGGGYSISGITTNNYTVEEATATLDPFEGGIWADETEFTLTGAGFLASGNTVTISDNADGTGDSVSATIVSQSTTSITAKTNSIGARKSADIAYIGVNSGGQDQYTFCQVYATPDYYVNIATGSDIDNNGLTPGAAFSSIQKAADIASAGDTIVVEDGNYYDTDANDIVLHITSGGLPGNFICYKSRNKWGAKIHGNDNSTAFGIANTSGNYIIFDGFEIKECNDFGVRGRVAGSSHWKLFHNRIANNGKLCVDDDEGPGFGRGGLISGSVASNWVLDGNIFYDNGRLHPADGCSTSTTDHENKDHNIYIGGNDCDDWEIINNVFDICRSGFHIQNSDPNSTNMVIANNTFIDGPLYRSSVIIMGYGGQATNMPIQNNIFENPSNGAVGYGTCSTFSNVDVSNNISSNTIEYPGNPTCSGISYSNNFEAPTLLGGDYKPQTGSPALGSGSGINAPAHDIRMAVRGASVDMGAYQITGVEE